MSTTSRSAIALHFAIVSLVMQADTVYIASQSNGAVTAYDAVSGAVQIQIASGLNNPTGLAVDRSGNLYINDFGNSVIRKYAVSTGTLSTFATLPAGRLAWRSTRPGMLMSAR